MKCSEAPVPLSSSTHPHTLVSGPADTHASRCNGRFLVLMPFSRTLKTLKTFVPSKQQLLWSGGAELNSLSWLHLSHHSLLPPPPPLASMSS